MRTYDVKDSEGKYHSIDAIEMALNGEFVVFFDRPRGDDAEDGDPKAIFYKPLSVVRRPVREEKSLA